MLASPTEISLPQLLPQKGMIIYKFAIKVISIKSARETPTISLRFYDYHLAA